MSHFPATKLPYCRNVRRIVELVLVAFGLVGCGEVVVFEATSVISDDGSLQRDVRFTGCERCRKTLTEKYRLPDGGTWRTETSAASAKEQKEPTLKFIYEKQIRYPRDAPIAGDYERHGTGEAAAHNIISLRVRNFFFVKTFDNRKAPRAQFRSSSTLHMSPKRCGISAARSSDAGEEYRVRFENTIDEIQAGVRVRSHFSDIAATVA